jgi:DNA-3-methyladenine glycosylase
MRRRDRRAVDRPDEPAAIALADLRARALPSTFFARPAPIVAEALLGCALVHEGRAGVIVETEAYLGPEDRASHARFGRTPRTDVMFGPAAVAYVYLCYGVHEMMNVVTGEDGEGQAVLLRAITPLHGLPDDPAIGRGPGKLTRALAIDRRLDRRPLGPPTLYVAAHATPTKVRRGPRIGVDYAGAWARRRLRFWI